MVSKKIVLLQKFSREVNKAMKHFFIINPYAGPTDTTREVKAKLQAFEEWAELDWETYVTRGPGDATYYTQQLCEEFGNDEIRIYACGGDGTLNEVLSGIIGHPNVQLACYPSGSGNDYLKYYGAKSDFRDIDRLIEGEPHPVDVMKVTVGKGPNADVRYCINVVDIGLDAFVAQTMINVKRKPIIGGSNAYYTGVVKAALANRRNYYKITVDGEVVNDENLMMCTLCNGRYVGGGYMCAPLSKNDDGLIDIYKFKPISILHFMSLQNIYRKGEHVDHPKFRPIMDFYQGTDVVLECKKPMPLAVDGEMLLSDYYHIELLHNAFDFIVPKGL